MLRGTELRLAIVVQNQASFALTRIGRDLKALQTQRDLAVRTEIANVRKLQAAQRVNTAATQLAQFKQGIPIQQKLAALQQTRLGLQNKVANGLSKEMGIQNKLYDLETKRQKLTFARRGAVASAAPSAQLAIMDRELQSINNQEALLTRNSGLLAGEMDQLAFRIASVTTEMKMNNLGSAESRAQYAALGLELRATKAQYAQVAIAAEQAAIAERQAANVRLATIGRSISHGGRATMLFGGIGVVALGAAASTFATFNLAAAKAATQMRGVNESFAHSIGTTGKLQNNILRLTKTLPQSATDMATAAYQIASGMNLQGDSTERLRKTTRLLQAADQVAVAGQVDLSSATESLISIFNNFDPQAKRIDQTLNTLFATVRFGRGDFSNFASTFGPVSAAARAADQTLVQMGGALAFLTQKLSQGQASAGLQRLYQIIARPEFVAGFQAVFKVPETVTENGITRLKKLSDIIGIILARAPELAKGGLATQNIIQLVNAAGLQAMGKKGAGTQGTIQAKKALGDLLIFSKDYADTLQNVTADTTEFGTALAIIQNQPGNKWQVTINQFKSFAIIIGQSVLPVVVKFIDKIAQVAHWFERLPAPIRSAIGQFAAWGSILLLLGGTLAIVIGSITSAIGAFRGLSMALGATGGVGALGRSAAMLGVLRSLKGIGVIAIEFELINKVSGGHINPAKWAFDLGKWARKQVNRLDIHSLELYNAKSVKVQDLNASDYKFAVSKGVRFYQEAQNVIVKLHGKTIATIEKQDTSLFAQLGRAHAFPDPTGMMLKNTVETNKQATKTILQQWQDLASNLTGLDVYGSLSKGATQVATNLQLALDKAHAYGNTTGEAKVLRQQLSVIDKQIKMLQNHATSPANRGKLDQLYVKRGQLLDALNSITNKQTVAQDRATNAVNRATTAQQNANNALAQAKLRLQELHKEQLAQLQSAFGAPFQGQIAQGPLGSAFTGVASTLAGFGQNFAIPSNITFQDQKFQQKQFERFTKDIGILSKAKFRGKKAPQEAINEILQGGVANLPFLEGIVHSPGKLAKEVQLLQQRGKAIATAAKTPWDTQLAAARIQLKAAELQYKHAKERVAAAKTAVTKAKAKDTAVTKTSSDRKLSVVHQHVAGETVVHADGASTSAVKRALRQHRFEMPRGIRSQ